MCADHWFCFHVLAITWHAGESQVFRWVVHPVFTCSLQLLPSVEVTCGICGEGQKLFASWMKPCLPDHSWEWEVFARQLVWRTGNPSKPPWERNLVSSKHRHHSWVKCDCKRLSDTVPITFTRKEVVVTCVNKLKSCLCSLFHWGQFHFLFSAELNSTGTCNKYTSYHTWSPLTCSLLRGFSVTLQITWTAVQKLFSLLMMMKLISGGKLLWLIHSVFVYYLLYIISRLWSLCDYLPQLFFMSVC